MTRRVTPPVPEQVTYVCDRCGKDMGKDFEAKITTDSRDYQGNKVAPGKERHLCGECTGAFFGWLNEVRLAERGARP